MSKQPVKRIVEVSHPYLLPKYRRDLYGGEMGFNLAMLNTYSNEGLSCEPCIYPIDFYVPIIAENNDYAVVYNWGESDLEYAHNGFILCKKKGVYENTDEYFHTDTIYKFSCPVVKPYYTTGKLNPSLEIFLDTLPHWLLISLDWS